MAKRTKTNKTDHVLNLLASGSKKGHSDSDSSAPPVDLKKKDTSAEEPPREPDPADEPLKKPEKKEEEINDEPELSEDVEHREIPEVSVVHLSGEENPLAESVKKSLEAELESYLDENGEKGQETEEIPELPKEAADEAQEEVQEEAQQQESAEATQTQMQDSQEELQQEEQASQEELQQEETDPVQTQAAEIPKEAAQTEPEQEAEKPEESAEPEEAEPEEEAFIAVNVMEQLVRGQVEGFIRQFGHCSCRRCVEDTTALALTHLPAKYVVVTKESVSPLLNFYEKKYAGQLIVEITKASMTVSEKPHH